jgi:threonine-phosphate decarboxylase
MQPKMDGNVTQEINKTDSIVAHNDNIHRLAEELRIPERKILDFSSPVNPLGVSKKVKAEMRRHLKYLNNHPDPETKRICQKLAQYHGISPSEVICGNGSTELVHLILKALRPRTVLIPSPSNAIYEKALLRVKVSEGWNGGPKIKYLELNEKDGFEIRPEEFINAIKENNVSPDSAYSNMLSGSVAFISNPNKTTGRLLNKGDIRKISEAAKKTGWHLVVDEALIDFCPGNSVIEDVADNPYLIVLRTQSYFHALAGLRIGYGIFHPGISVAFRETGETLPVNSLAQRAAVIAVRDKVYEKETLKVISEEKRFLERSFRRLGIDYFPSDANVYLLKTWNPDETKQRLRKKGILLRDYYNVKGLGSGYLGIAVKSHRENAVLIRELTSILQK